MPVDPAPTPPRAHPPPEPPGLPGVTGFVIEEPPPPPVLVIVENTDGFPSPPLGLLKLGPLGEPAPPPPTVIV